MTKQEVFNRVWQHFIVEKQPRSVSPLDTTCWYRAMQMDGCGGPRCAVGLFIPDGEYRVGMECGNVHDLLAMEDPPPSIVALAKDVGGRFLRDLQIAHDRVAELRPIERNLRDVAMEHGLEVAA